MRLPAAVLLAGLLVSGCGQSDQTVTAENASAAEVQQKLKEAGGTGSFVRPGQWEQRATLLDIDMPGMPPEMKARMRQAMGTAQTHSTCLTPEQAKNPREDFFAGVDKSCRYETFRWGEGKIDVRMTCDAEGRTQAMNLAGTYTPDTYQLEMLVQGQGEQPGPSGQMTMKMRVDARRVGECTGKEKS